MRTDKYENLIEFLTKEHDLILLDSEIQEIENNVDTDLKRLNLALVIKRAFNFDYISRTYVNKSGHRVGSVKTVSIDAWDEEHATLLFKEMYPDKSFDTPY